jgi:tetratricopeptide (TPR) repeat protein
MRQTAIQLFDAGAYTEARMLLEQLCAMPPVSPDLQGRLAFILLQQGDHAAAESLLRSAVTVQPADAQLRYWLAVAVARQDRMEEARGIYESVLTLAPEMPEAHNDLGHVLRTLGDHVGAEQHFRKAVEISPHLTGALYNLGLSCAERGAFAEAETWCRKVLVLAPDHFETLNNLANILRQSDRMEEAVDCYRHAIQVRPESALAHANLAHTLENLHRLDDAQIAAQRALQLEPLNPLASVVAAQASRRKGRLEQARLQLEPLAFANLPPAQSAAVNAELGQILDRVGDYRGAYDAWTRSNAAWITALGRERTQDCSYLDYVEEVANYFSRERPDRWPARFPESSVPAPVFLAGFPRSGTTLMEQLLSAHSVYYGSREIPVLSRLCDALPAISTAAQKFPRALDGIDDDAAVRLRSEYWRIADAAVECNAEKTVMVDKLPLNLVELGLVRRIFPDARVIIMLRDPRDVCLSAFAQAFQPNRAMVHFLSLERTARLYGRIMDLWIQYRSVLGLHYTEVRYEDLVENLEPTMRKVFDFLACDWEPAVLDYHEAARKHYARTPSYQDVTSPVYTRSLGRWQRYRDRLEPVLPLLEKYIAAFGYRPS